MCETVLSLRVGGFNGCGCSMWWNYFVYRTPESEGGGFCSRVFHLSATIISFLGLPLAMGVCACVYVYVCVPCLCTYTRGYILVNALSWGLLTILVYFDTLIESSSVY